MHPIPFWVNTKSSVAGRFPQEIFGLVSIVCGLTAVNALWIKQRRLGLFQLDRSRCFKKKGSSVDAPHGVEKEDEKPPQGNELKAPFGELVVTRCRQMAA
jgi:hypothetical protein